MNRPAVILLTQVFPPESQAGANRAGAMARALAAISDLTVVTTRPSYPSPEFHREKGTLVGHDEAQPFQIVRTSDFHPHRGSIIIRAVRELTMAGRLAWTAGRQRGDVLVATSPSVFVSLSGALASVLRRTPLIIDLRDLTWEYVADDARRSNSKALLVLSRLLRSAARLAFERAALISASNVGIRRALVDLGIPEDRILDTPNGVSKAILDSGLRLSDPPELPEQPVVTYAGALGYYQGIGTLLDVAAALPEVQFRIIGDGPERNALVESVADRGLKNVSLPGYVDRDSLFEHYAQSDILFAQLRDLSVLARATFPSKPYELMATGRPIVYAGRGITAEFLEATGSALIAEPENPDSIASCIRRLLSDADLRRRLSANGRTRAPAYLREEIMAEFAEAVTALANS